jgi:chromosome segregation ATPase
MLKLLFGKLDSTKLKKRIEDLRADLEAAEAGIEQRQEALEVALSEGKPSEKPLGDLASARTKAEALQAVLTRAEREMAALEAREEAARNRAAIAALAVRFEKLKGEMSRGREKIVAAAAETAKAVETFAVATGDLRDILAALGDGNLSTLLPSGREYAEGRSAEADSNLRSVFSRIEAAIRGAQGQVKEAAA